MLLNDQTSLDLRPNETVADAIQRIRTHADSNAQRGTWFEHLFKSCVRDLPEFEIENIWTWRDWPERESTTGRDGRDYGIDLVAQLKSGERVAIQCKFYEPNHKVSKPDINSFISEARLGWFDLRWIVSTSEWNSAAEKAIRDQTPPVRRIDFLEYLDRTIKEFTAPAERQPKKLQETAIEDVYDGLVTQNNERGKLIMACGTGKTFVSLRVAERIVPDNGRILFAAPSISLVSQARREWLTYTQRPMSSLVVCSDETAGGRGENQVAGPDDLVCPVQSDPFKIAKHLKKTDKVKVIFTTYHSLRHVVEAQRVEGVPKFDLAIADEAHQTTGVESKTTEKANFQLFHDQNNLFANKRLYMTATERIYTESSKSARAQHGIKVIDMGDVDIYGPELARVKFKDAVAAQDLSDYRVIVLGVHESNLTPRLRETGKTDEAQKAKIEDSDIARLVGTAMAMNGFVEGKTSEKPERLHRTIAYASNINRSKWFANTITSSDIRGIITRKYGGGNTRGLTLQAVHLDAKSTAVQRSHELRALNDAGKNNEARLISNVRIFTEGVDVPALDAVSFLDPRKSQLDIVQAVGRVMRRAQGKQFGYIIVPICIPENVQNIADTLALREDGYKAIGEVLRALQSHDERLADSIADFIIMTETNPNAAPPTEKDPEEIHHNFNAQAEFELRNVNPENLFTHVVSASGLGKPGQMTAITIEGAVKRAARYIANERNTIDEIRNVLEMPEIPQDANQNDIRAAITETATVAALLICNACLMHKRLKSDAEGMTMLTSLETVMRAQDPIESLIGTWETILERDFEPIFRPALSILNAIPRSDNATNAIRVLAECAANLADDLSELGYDHAGPLYHRILASAESDGAFYTKHISALMLAGLALSPNMIDWSNPEAVKKLKVLDPACGTGTLLMAALKIIKDRALQAGAFNQNQMPELHQHLVQNSIRGLDINYQATQLAASNLTLGAPSVNYKSMHIHTMKHGPQPDGDVRLGSLELLVDAVRGNQPDLFANAKHAPLSHEVKSDRDDIELDMRDTDIVIMNPPFTNNVKRSKRYGPDDAKLMQEREGSIKEHIASLDELTGGVIDSNSVETFFAPLAESLLDKTHGVMGQVMPTTSCVGVAAAEKREYLSNRFHIDMIVTSHDPKHPNFSENTGIHESLIACRRRTDANEGMPTRFISLKRMPETSDDVNEWLSDLHSGNESRWHNVYHWPREKVAQGDWTPAQYYDGSIVVVVDDIGSNSLLKPIGDLAALAPAPQGVRSAFVNPTNIPHPPPPPPRVQYHDIFFHVDSQDRTTTHNACHARVANGTQNPKTRLCNKIAVAMGEQTAHLGPRGYHKRPDTINLSY